MQKMQSKDARKKLVSLAFGRQARSEGVLIITTSPACTSEVVDTFSPSRNAEKDVMKSQDCRRKWNVLSSIALSYRMINSLVRVLDLSASIINLHDALAPQAGTTSSIPLLAHVDLDDNHKALMHILVIMLWFPCKSHTQQHVP